MLIFPNSGNMDSTNKEDISGTTVVSDNYSDSIDEYTSLLSTSASPSISDNSLQNIVGENHDDSESQNLTNDPDFTKRRSLISHIKKNIFVITITFCLLFISMDGLDSLQSSLNHQQGIGVITSCIVFSVNLLTSLFLPKFIIHKLGHRWTMALSSLGHLPWMASNGYAVWATMVPASVIIGVCSTLLWTSQAVYFTEAATLYSKISGEKQDIILSKFFGFFYLMQPICK